MAGVTFAVHLPTNKQHTPTHTHTFFPIFLCTVPHHHHPTTPRPPPHAPFIREESEGGPLFFLFFLFLLFYPPTPPHPTPCPIPQPQQLGETRTPSAGPHNTYVLTSVWRRLLANHTPTFFYLFFPFFKKNHPRLTTNTQTLTTTERSPEHTTMTREPDIHTHHDEAS